MKLCISCNQSHWRSSVTIRTIVPLQYSYVFTFCFYCYFAAAVPSSGNRCEQEAEYGGCTELLERWYWDQLSGRCERFWYSGCHGNDNNFETETDCDVACGQSQPTTTRNDSETDREGTAAVMTKPSYEIMTSHSRL